MPRYFYLLLILISSVHFAAGQTISGSVFDENQSPVAFANVVLFSPDSSMVTGAVTDDSGHFSINTKPGQYLIKISFLSFEDKWIPRVTVAEKDVTLDRLVLSAGSKVLEAVTVQGEKSQM